MEINTDTDTTLVKEMTFIVEILQSMVKNKIQLFKTLWDAAWIISGLMKAFWVTPSA